MLHCWWPTPSTTVFTQTYGLCFSTSASEERGNTVHFHLTLVVILMGGNDTTDLLRVLFCFSRVILPHPIKNNYPMQCGHLGEGGTGRDAGNLKRIAGIWEKELLGKSLLSKE